MEKQLYIVITALLSIFWQDAAAQLVHSGANITIGQNALVYVSNDFTHKTGEIHHDGDIIVGGDWINESNNDRVFNDLSSGIVTMTGSRAIFSGIGTTVFPNLKLSGTAVFNMKVKVSVAKTLNLGDAELQVNDNELTMLDGNPAAIKFNAGFISTGKSGLVLRTLNQQTTYIYPLGSAKLASKRFVSISPKSIQKQIIGAAFVDVDPNLTGYDRSVKSKTVAEVNQDFYHILKRTEGNGNVDVAFHTTSNEKYTNLINWTQKNVWDRVVPSSFLDNTNTIGGLTKSFVSPSTNLMLDVINPYAFANITSVSPLVIFNAFSPDGDGKNETWEIKNIDAFPDNDLKIFDRSGNLVFKANGYNSSAFWDGKNVASGTYIYILRANIDGKNEYFKGAITMIKN